MNEESGDTGGNGSTQTMPQFSVQRIYIKDLSFEIPNAPAIYNEPGGEQDINFAVQQCAMQCSRRIIDVVTAA